MHDASDGPGESPAPGEAPPSPPGGPGPGSTAAPPGHGRRRRGGARCGLAGLAGLLAAAAAALLWAWRIEPERLEVTRHAVGAGPTAVTLVHLTDLHVARLGARERRVLEVVAAERPDLVVVTGDTVTALGEGLQAAPVTSFLAALAALRPPLGTWAVRGNHEDWAGEAALRCYRDAGVPLLDDASRPLLDGRLVLHGLATPVPPARPLATPGFDVVLCHYPAVLPRVAGPGLELVLAGHTHGGQVCAPGGHPLALPFESGGFAAGWFEDRGTRLFVSRGVGTSVVPLRFACRPEVAVLTLGLAR